MDGSLIAIAGFVLALVALDLAALRFGRDSRTGEREMPYGTDPGRPRRPRHRRRTAPASEDVPVVTALLVLNDAGPAGAPVVELPVAPRVGRKPAGKRFAPYTPAAETFAYLRFDMAATGK